jgi:salicylate hydroxylase
MKRTDRPVLVVGGGISGLAVALTLARKGLRVRVLEQSAEFKEIGAGIQLGPNAFRMFKLLGLTEAIDRLAFYPGNLVMMDGITGEEVVRMPVGGEAFRARFGHPYAVIHRADLHQVLLQACRAEKNIELSALTKGTRYEDFGDRVALHLDSGEVLEGSALIGADGLWSQIRNQLLGDGKPRVSGHIAYRAVLPRSEVEKSLWRDDVVLWAGPRTHLVHYPLRRGELYNIVAVFHSNKYEEGWDVYGDPDELREKFSVGRPEVRQLLAKINVWKMWVLCDREPVREWAKGRVTLIGDAAHPMLQYLAQGANMAIEDAVVMAAYVELSGFDFERAFRWYQDERYLRTARVQITARYYGDVFHAAGVLRELRNNLFVPKPGTDPKAPPTFDGVAWLYDGIEVPTAPRPRS